MNGARSGLLCLDHFRCVISNDNGGLSFRARGEAVRVGVRGQRPKMEHQVATLHPRSMVRIARQADELPMEVRLRSIRSRSRPSGGPRARQGLGGRGCSLRGLHGLSGPEFSQAKVEVFNQIDAVIHCMSGYLELGRYWRKEMFEYRAYSRPFLVRLGLYIWAFYSILLLPSKRTNNSPQHHMSSDRWAPPI